MLFVALEFSNILVTIGVRIYPFSVEKTLFECSDVFIAGELSIRPPGFTRPARLLTFPELSDISARVSLGIGALPLEQVVPK